MSIAASIGRGGHDSQLQTIADACRRLHTGRTEAELVIQDLPDAYPEQGLADKFIEF